jgi:hypothetical protein
MVREDGVVRWAVRSALVVVLVICFALALAAVLGAVALVAVWYNDVAEDFVLLAALLCGPAPWIVAVILWEHAERSDLLARLALTASGSGLVAFLAVAIMFAAAVLGDTTGTARY